MLLGDARDSPPSCPTHAGETRIFIYENARLSGSGRNIAGNVYKKPLGDQAVKIKIMARKIAIQILYYIYTHEEYLHTLI